MRKTILTYGVIAGAITIGSAILADHLIRGNESMTALEWLGYLVMIVALSMIVVAIRRYRDDQLGGVIRFSTAALLGIGISAVAGVVYVAAWEVNLALTDHAFIDEYSASVIAEETQKGVAGAELDALVAEMEQMKAQYANPLFRLPITFLEIFPVGLVISLLSAAFLRTRNNVP